MNAAGRSRGHVAAGTCVLRFGLRAVAALALAGTAVPALATQARRTLEAVIVEERVPGDFEDFDAWSREVRDALGRATLKRRGELTAHDHGQILILEREMPVLRWALDDIERLVRANRFRQTLTQRETLQLAKAYQTAESVLENVPDAFMPRCRLRPKYGQRNEAAVCGIDYGAIERQVDEYRRKRLRGEASDVQPVQTTAAPPKVAFIKVASSPPPRGPERAHVAADYLRPGQVRIAFEGQPMLMREDFHALATELPVLKPAHPLRLELPTGTGISLGPGDALKVVGYVSMAGERLRVAQLPRAAGAGYGIVVHGDGAIEGTLVAYEYGWSNRRRMAPINGLRAIVIPADTRLIVQYEVHELLAGSQFVRYDLVYRGARADKLFFELRRYDAPPPSTSARSTRFEFERDAGVVVLAGLEIELREVEPERIKYVVRSAAPAAAALAGPP